MKRATDKIADAIKAGKPPRRNGKSRCIGPAEALRILGQDAAGQGQRWVAAPHEREAEIARRIEEAHHG